MRYVGNESDFRRASAISLRDDVFGEHQATDDHQRKAPKRIKKLRCAGLAERLHACTLVLDAQCQPVENIFELARNLRFPSLTRGNGRRFEFVSHIHVRRIDHHCKWISALVTQLRRD